MFDSKHKDIDVKYVEAGDWVSDHGLFRVVSGVTYDHVTKYVTLIFDHGDYLESISYPFGTIVTIRD